MQNLDDCVKGALRLYSTLKNEFPPSDFDLDNFQNPWIFASGNAFSTGEIMFQGKDAVFADESTYETALDPIDSIHDAILISASGGKHATEIGKFLTESKKVRGQITLFTCNPEPAAKPWVDKLLLFPHLEEPYTYNTSTYMGMILAATEPEPRNQAEAILKHIETFVEPSLANFTKSLADFDAFFLIVPDELSLIKAMLTTKFVELFGRKFGRDVFTCEQTKHGTTVVPSETELFISFGIEPSAFDEITDLLGKHRLPIPLPENAGYAAMMAVAYYVIGRIQAQMPPWFRDSIEEYCRKLSNLFDQKDIKATVKYP